MALCGTGSVLVRRSKRQLVSVRAHFERESCLDFVRQHFSHHAVKIVQDLHGELGLDAAFVDQIVDSVDERLADAVNIASVQFSTAQSRKQS